MKTVQEFIDSLKYKNDVSRHNLDKSYNQFLSGIREYSNYGGDAWLQMNPEDAKPILEYAVGARNVIDMFMKKCIDGGIAQYNPKTGKFEFIED